jgi:hypothetical protein
MNLLPHARTLAFLLSNVPPIEKASMACRCRHSFSYQQLVVHHYCQVLKASLAKFWSEFGQFRKKSFSSATFFLATTANFSCSFFPAD